MPLKSFGFVFTSLVTLVCLNLNPLILLCLNSCSLCLSVFFIATSQCLGLVFSDCDCASFSVRAPIGQGYGLTETCAGATFSEWDDPAVGRVGPPLPCGYVKVCRQSFINTTC